jgi:O-antigen/teichoic acid export membrane protein
VGKSLTFVKDVSTNFVKKTVLLVSGIIISIVIARVLGPTGKGIYALIMLVPSMLFLLGELGITMANVFYIGKKKIEISKLSYNSLIFGLINGLILVIIFLAIYPFIKDSVFKGVNPEYIYLILIIVPFNLTTNYLSGILLGLLKIKQSCNIIIIKTIINTSGILIILFIFSGYIVDLIIFSVLLEISMFVFYVLYIGKLTNFAKKYSWNSFKKCFNYGSKGYLADMFMFFNYRLDIFMINFFIGVTAVGYYSLSVGLAEMIWIIPGTISFVLFPNVSSKSKKESAELTATTCRHSFFLSLILCSLAAFFSKYAIEILYGKSFLQSYLPLLILLPGILINSTGSLTSSYLCGIGKVIYSPIITSTMLVINITLNIILIPIYGIIGAAIASSICYSYGAILSVFFFLKHSDVKLKDIYIFNKGDILFYINIIRKR